MDKQRALCLKAVSLIFQHTQILLIRPFQVDASVLYFLLQITILHIVKQTSETESTYSSRNRFYSGTTAIWEKRPQYRTGLNSKNNGGK